MALQYATEECFDPQNWKERKSRKNFKTAVPFRQFASQW